MFRPFFKTLLNQSIYIQLHLFVDYYDKFRNINYERHRN